MWISLKTSSIDNLKTNAKLCYSDFEIFLIQFNFLINNSEIFVNSWSNVHTRYFIPEIKSRFTGGEKKQCWNAVKFESIMTRIAAKFSFQIAPNLDFWIDSFSFFFAILNCSNIFAQRNFFFILNLLLKFQEDIGNRCYSITDFLFCSLACIWLQFFPYWPNYEAW